MDMKKGGESSLDFCEEKKVTRESEGIWKKFQIEIGARWERSFFFFFWLEPPGGDEKVASGRSFLLFVQLTTVKMENIAKEERLRFF